MATGPTPAEAPLSSSTSNGAYRRRRVAKACQSCRSMKAKCDGQWPECGRCIAYGSTCVYRAHRPRLGGARRGASPPEYGGMAEKLPELCEAIGQQGALLERAIASIADLAEREDALRKHALIRVQIDRAFSSLGAGALPGDTATADRGSDDVEENHIDYHHQQRRARLSPEPPPYLGEVSDVYFFNLVKRVLQTHGGSGDSRNAFDDYGQDDSRAPSQPAIGPSTVIDLPDQDTAAKYMDSYFSTIHLAYPFIPKSVFLREHQKIRNKSPERGTKDAQLALTYTIFAIGSYYTSFPGQTEGAKARDDHERYFSRALALSPLAGTDRSLTFVSLLLAQCFYLLAVSRIDSCWTTLGQAARAAQSIGLHVETQIHPTKPGLRLETEQRRRVWFSIYVLDRLLALQLGRPPAIHDDDCHGPLPSRLGDADIDWDIVENLDSPGQDPSSGDYFIAMIAFSGIIGTVLRSLNCPVSGRLAPEDLIQTRNLDSQLLRWKHGLQRVLRFDLSHAFEKSYIYQRQRNMLAIKFHHLRALIHRPYLCLPLLKREDACQPFTPSDWALVHLYEKTCTAEARETARLLHGIVNEQDLVHSFPWWQMISCLVCAGSILLVSSIFADSVQQQQQQRRYLSQDLTAQDTAELRDDAAMCLKVFEVLSIHSDGAKTARDMMRALADMGISWMTSGENGMAPAKALHDDACGPDARNQRSTADTETELPGTTHSAPGQALRREASALQQLQFAGTEHNWPMEILNTITWSAHFFDASAPDVWAPGDGL